ncbi:hypothetical protein [Actinoallomurus iriomotensis]|uniref:Uncharacterized protein n=1 Tax=Actinoallomurus iriomotensis TaxID=478107 RepID=A0A9W6RHD2_9ACTN|nr:hypothetical protein [Actinoallomurus iriomotensis]GLY75844.1 hypothetical protein Airi01_041110 [Actinoallomurus iriomotensis]
MPDRAAEEREKDPTPRTPSGRVLGTVGPALFGLGVLAVVVGLGGILIADAVYAWVLVLTAGLAAGLLGTALGLAADSAAPTGAWRSPGGAVTLVLRRVAVVIGAVVAAVGIPLFALKVAGFIGGYHTEAYGAKPVEVAISGSCGTVRNNPLVSVNDKTTCSEASWVTPDGRSVSGTLHGTYGEIAGGMAAGGGAAHVDSVKAYVRGRNAYTPHAAHRRKPGSTHRLSRLTGWAWLGIPVSLAGLGLVNIGWSPKGENGTGAGSSARAESRAH